MQGLSDISSKLGLYFLLWKSKLNIILFWKSELKIKSVVQLSCVLTVYDYVDLTSKVVINTKLHRICKMSSKGDRILIKINIAIGNEAWHGEIVCRVPNKHWPLTTVLKTSVCSGGSLTLERSTDNTWEWMETNSFLNKNALQFQ